MRKKLEEQKKKEAMMSPEEKAELEAKREEKQHQIDVQKALEDEIDALPVNIKVNGFDF